MTEINQTLSDHAEILVDAIRWLLSKQNHDGSWGKDMKEKVRWTSNAVYTLSLLGFNPKKSNKLKKAVEWLKNIPMTYEEWFLRIPALSLAHYSDKSHQDKDYERAKQLFKQDLVGPLPFKTALALELISEGVEVPNIELIHDAIIRSLRKEHQDLYSFGGSTNNTTLYANFLMHINNGEEEKDIIEKCLHWVKLRGVEKFEGNALCWEESYGKTAYVIVNAVELSDYLDDFEDMLCKALNYFKPLKNGAIPQDKVPAHESRSSIYTTILYIRAIGTLLKHNTGYYEYAFKALLTKLSTGWKKVSNMTKRWIHFIFPAIICVAIGGLLYLLLGRNFAFGILSSIAAASILSLYMLLKKLFDNIWHPSD